MALQPVSGVTPLHTANVSFSGKRYNEKNENNEYNTSSSRIPSSVKTVPVIVLMAMSPLNKVNSTTPYLPEENNIEVVETPEMSPIIRPTAVNRTVTPKQVGSNLIIYPKGSKKMPMVLRRLSLDENDSDYEAVEFVKINNLDEEHPIISSRALLTTAYYNKKADGIESLSLSGVELSKDNIEDFRVHSSGRFVRSITSDNTAFEKDYFANLKAALEILLNEQNNNGAFKMGSYVDVRSAGANARKKYANILGTYTDAPAKSQGNEGSSILQPY